MTTRTQSDEGLTFTGVFPLTDDGLDKTQTDPKTGRAASNRDSAKMAGNAVTSPAARDLVATIVASLTGEVPA